MLRCYPRRNVADEIGCLCPKVNRHFSFEMRDPPYTFFLLVIFVEILALFYLQ